MLLTEFAPNPRAVINPDMLVRPIEDCGIIKGYTPMRWMSP